MLKKQSKTKDIILNHIKQNKREYASVVIVFFIGLIIGVIFINNSGSIQKTQINQYINSFVSNAKLNENLDNFNLIKNSIAKNCVIIFILWFVGLAVISIPLIYLSISFRGFCLGYTVSAIIATLGTWKGLGFIASGIFLQNILFIPCMFGVGVSGLKLYKGIKNKKGNIKSEILRHSFFSVFVLIFVIISSAVETYISSNLLAQYIKYL